MKYRRPIPHVDMLKRCWNDRDTQGGWGQWTTISKLNGSTWLQTTKAWQKAKLFFLKERIFGATKMPQGLVDLGQEIITLNKKVSCAITLQYIYVSSDAISANLGAWFTIACNLGGGRISATFELESENPTACFGKLSTSRQTHDFKDQVNVKTLNPHALRESGDAFGQKTWFNFSLRLKILIFTSFTQYMTSYGLGVPAMDAPTVPPYAPCRFKTHELTANLWQTPAVLSMEKW